MSMITTFALLKGAINEFDRSHLQAFDSDHTTRMYQSLFQTLTRSLSLPLMAAKPNPSRLHHLADRTWQSAAKKPRTMCTTNCSSSALKDAFGNYAEYLNELNDKRERVVKASRDITMNSKKVIFQVHRIDKNNKEEVLAKAEKDLEAVRSQHISRLVKELQGTDFWKLRRAYSPGVQEYVEAATFCKFCRTGSLLNLDELNATLLPLSDPSVEPMQINILDYLLGLADLTGELMRLAIGRISDGELEFAKRICSFVRDIHRELMLVVPDMDDNHDMKSKMETLLQSVMKIENGMSIVLLRLRAVEFYFEDSMLNLDEDWLEILLQCACKRIGIHPVTRIKGFKLLIDGSGMPTLFPDFAYSLIRGFDAVMALGELKFGEACGAWELSALTFPVFQVGHYRCNLSIVNMFWGLDFSLPHLGSVVCFRSPKLDRVVASVELFVDIDAEKVDVVVSDV
ncbi:Translin-associated protein X-like protein [Drosera capensis]